MRSAMITLCSGAELPSPLLDIKISLVSSFSLPLVKLCKMQTLLIPAVVTVFSLVSSAPPHPTNSTFNKLSFLSSSHAGSERDLMVVLPVMQGNLDLTNSNLQHLYTKPPVTAIIGHHDTTAPSGTKTNLYEMSFSQPRLTSNVTTWPTPAVTSTWQKLLVADKRMGIDEESEEDSDFLPKQSELRLEINKAPLEYGYPDTLKYVQELNELPKNHKPTWALTENKEPNPDDLDKPFFPGKPMFPGDDDPYQMFESVKPLEINKLLSFKPAVIPTTDSIEEAATRPTMIQMVHTKPSIMKRPSKKPQKTKLSPQKLTDAELSFLTNSQKPLIQVTEPDNGKRLASRTTCRTYEEEEIITMKSETTKGFLPTPYSDSQPSHTIIPIIRHIIPKTSTDDEPSPYTTTVSSTTIVSSTTTTSTTQKPVISPNFQWANTNETAGSPGLASSLQSTTIHPFEIQPFHIAGLNKILGEKFKEMETMASEDNTKHSLAPVLTSTQPTHVSTLTQSSISIPTTTTTTTLSPFPEDHLSPDVKNMLIALGIIKSEPDALYALSTPTTTPHSSATHPDFLIDVFGTPVPGSQAPAVNPESYMSFKKIPTVGSKLQRDKVSDDMRELLVSFGLLPKQAFINRLGYNNPLQRISRQLETEKPVQDSTTSNAEKLKDSSQPTDLEKINQGVATSSHISQPNSIPHASQNSSETMKDLDETLGQLTTSMDSKTAANSSILTDFSTKPKLISGPTNPTSESNSKESGSKALNTSGPDPLSSEELQYFVEYQKNDIKRQESGKDSNSTSTEASSTASKTSATFSSSTEAGTTTVASNNAPIPALAESFGGGETASQPPSVDETPPPQRPNGLYFYVDWNSFLNVGEAEKNPVRVRFSPRAGNARNFLPITVP